MINSTLPSSYKGVPGLALHLYIDKGKAKLEGKGKIVYLQQGDGAGTIVQRKSGVVASNPNELLMMSSIGGKPYLASGPIDFPNEGLLLYGAATSFAANTFTLLTGGTGAGSLSTDATVPKPQGGDSNKLTITDGGSAITDVSIIDGELTPISITNGKRISIILRMKAAATKTVQVSFAQSADPTVAVTDVQSVSVSTKWENYVFNLLVNASTSGSDYLRIDAGGNTTALWFSNLDIWECQFPPMPREYSSGVDYLYVLDNFNQFNWQQGTLLLRGYIPFWEDDGVANMSHAAPCVFEAWVGSSNRIRIQRIGGTTRLGALFVKTTSQNIVVSGASKLTHYQVHNIALAWQNGKQTMYVNGVSVATGTLTLQWTTPHQANTQIAIGGIQGNSATNLNGVVESGKDNGLFYFKNRHLSNSELAFVTRRDNIF